MATPKLRFKEFDEEWVSKKIIDLADYVDYRGKTPKKVESGVLLVTAKNIKQGYLDYSTSQEFIELSEFDEVMRRGKVELNDVLITTEAPLGNVASVDRVDIALAQRVIKYRGKVNLLDNLFLKQKFLSESFQEILLSKATGGTVKGIKGSILHQIPLEVPSKSEQIKISSFLSAVDEKISLLTRKHELLIQYKHGIMQKLFSQQIRFKADDGSEFGEWEETTLSKIVNFHNGKRVPLSETERQNRQGPYRYYGASGVIDYIDDYLFDGQYILIGEDGANILTRSSTLAFVVQGQFWVNNHAHIFESKSGNNFFLAAYLESLNYEKFNSGTAQPKLNLENLKKVPVINPCLEEQTKIANFLSAIDQKIEVVVKQIEQAKQWKKGLLQQMFV